MGRPWFVALALVAGLSCASPRHARPAGDPSGDPLAKYLQEGYVVRITNPTLSLRRLPIYLAQATGYHSTLATLVAQGLLILAYAVAGLFVYLPTRRRARRPPQLAEA